MNTPVNQDNVARVIVLVRGMMENGKGFYWCYVAVKPSLYEQFKAVTGNKYNIQNFVADGYGEVIVSGSGRDAPKEVTEKVAEMFGVAVGSLFTDSNPLGTISKKLLEEGASGS
ncbi:MAG: hypothetical protein EBR02_10205 [Alphaproteobacteria bacterium]|nr:hypothetical protein [Alphaproteobacteria bacterium]